VSSEKLTSTSTYLFAIRSVLGEAIGWRNISCLYRTFDKQPNRNERMNICDSHEISNLCE